LEAGVVLVADAQDEHHQHRVEVEQVEGEHAILGARTAHQPDEHEDGGDHVAAERERDGDGEQRAHSKISRSGFSYRSLKRPTKAASSRTSQTCSMSLLRSSASSDQTVPGTTVVTIERAASPTGSRSSRGMTT